MATAGSSWCPSRRKAERPGNGAKSNGRTARPTPRGGQRPHPRKARPSCTCRRHRAIGSAVGDRLTRTGVAVTAAPDVTEAMQLLVDAPVRALRAGSGRRPRRARRDPCPPDPARAAADRRDHRSGQSARGRRSARAPARSICLPWPFDERDVLVVLANARDRTVAETAAASAQAGRRTAVRAIGRHAVRRRSSFAPPPTFAAACSFPASRAPDASSSRARFIAAPKARHRVRSSPLTARTARRRSSSGGCSAWRPTAGSRDGKPPVVDRVGRGGRCRSGHRRHAAAHESRRGAGPRARHDWRRLLRDREAMVAEKRTIIELDIRPSRVFDPMVEAAVTDGRLRRDLYERLVQTVIEVPPLRRRREDIPALAVHFLRKACRRPGAPQKSFSRSALTLLAALPWHGNARELQQLVGTLVRSVRRPVIQLDDLLDQASLEGLAARVDPGLTLREAKARFERDCISADAHEAPWQGRRGGESSGDPADKPLPESETTERFALPAFSAQMRRVYQK